VAADLELGRVWWLDEALAAGFGAEPAPPLEGDAEADVAIVGGGYTGLWTALALKERDPSLDVVVLEAEECERLLRGFLTPRMFEAGLICRADDRGDPVIQISPPLVAGDAEWDELVGILGTVLEEAWQRI